MATSFFTSWALWEKMSFVLVLAILVVFGIAYGKLVWTNRLSKKKEGEFEERRVAIEQSRRSGQLAETWKSQDIPFGVRAIQSGLQVDGIWISKDSTPISASLRLGHIRNSSADRSDHQVPSPRASPRASLDSSQTAVPSPSSRGRITRRESESRTLLAEQRTTSTEVQDVRIYRTSYKPRKSSHLRYGSNGEINYHEETLDQLEGKAANTEMDLQKPYETPEMENDQFSEAAADNKHSLGSVTDISLSTSTNVGTVHHHHQSLPVKCLSGQPLPNIAKVAAIRPPRSSLPSQSSKAEYLPVPLEPPGHERSDLFSSSLSDPVGTSLPFKPPYARTAPELTACGESQVPLLAHSRSPSPFIPGELHVNKSVRRVNSGFEVLPAGTFGLPSVLTSKRAAQDDETEKRQLNKLQKKIRISTSS